MREHQIVISLKADQYQQVQQMARASGSGSVGTFIRQRLLAALGLVNQEHSPEAESSGPSWRRISGELKRLHRELQVFIAESAESAGTFEYSDEGLVQPEHLSEQGDPMRPGSDYGHAAANNDASQSSVNGGDDSGVQFMESEDAMEALAERAFSISPRLGALEPFANSSRKFPDPLQELLEEALIKGLEDASDDLDEDTQVAVSSAASGAMAAAMADQEELNDDHRSQAVGYAEQSEPIYEAAQDSYDVHYQDEEQYVAATAETHPVEDDDQSAYQQAIAESDGEYENAQTIGVGNEEDAGSGIGYDTTSGVSDHSLPPPHSGPVPPPISGGPPPRKRKR